ncbi:Glutaminase kidney isoform_ mitochondriallike [Caligus rogercresseyi]|uniref:glutaminase n=1 Tax=Caligus rogercresseyi TaxID=217165 RepID=A0A7T8KE39_CALRO|nr:Glutaminase kidney isoform_ mitochondriallike [Caligus rogercresseyi]
MAGGEYVGFNNVDYLAQRIGMDQQKAVAYFMRENKCFPEDVNLVKTLDFNAQACQPKLIANNESNAVMAATLASGGICPIRSEKILEQTTVDYVLALMYTCGLHLSAGEFAFNVRTRIDESILYKIIEEDFREYWSSCHVLWPWSTHRCHTNVMGISLWSPKLDPLNNSPINHFYRTIAMIQAAANGDLTELKIAYLQNNNINTPDGDQRTALHLACAEGHINCIRFLLYQCRANAYLPDSEAVKSDNEEVRKIMADYVQKYPKGIPDVDDNETKGDSNKLNNGKKA